MKVLGITGGVGSGKSRVLSYLKEKDGVVVYEADQIARLEQAKGTKCFKAIIEYFGEDVVDEQGELDRKALGNIVFQDESQLQKLNQIVHPLVRQKVEELIDENREKGKKLFVFEAAILLESEYQDLCDEIWYIYCDEQIRMERLHVSRGYSVETFRNITSKQMPEEWFREKCQVVIDNSFDEIHLIKELEEKLKPIV